MRSFIGLNTWEVSIMGLEHLGGVYNERINYRLEPLGGVYNPYSLMLIIATRKQLNHI
jgi:hypothetical protein